MSIQSIRGAVVPVAKFPCPSAFVVSCLGLDQLSIEMSAMFFCRWQEGVFTNLRQLTSVVITENLISYIEPRVFVESANLSSLSHIDLSSNVITELEPWPLIRAQHRPMTVLLNENRIINFTNSLQWSFGCSSPRVYKSRLDLGENHIQHITDAVNGWNIADKQSKYPPILNLWFIFYPHFKLLF